MNFPPIDPVSVRTDFLNVIKSFSRYLSFQKQSGIAFPKISEESKAIISKWGKQSFVQSSFLCQGPETAQVFIIDSQASFFKGDAGQMLSRILAAMGLSDDMVLICTSEAPEDVQHKISKVLPKVIITLGQKAGKILLGPRFSLDEFQGKFNDFNGIKVMPTFHPSLLLEEPQYKRQVWEDMKQVMAYAGLKHGAK